MEPVTQALLAARRLKRAYSKKFEPLCAREQLTSPQLDVLLFLGNNPGFDTARDIVELRGLAKSHVSKSVEELMAKGLLTSRQEQADRRRVHLGLTQRAMPLLKEAQAVQQDFFRSMYAGFTQQEKLQMELFLKRMAENTAMPNDP